MQQPHLLQRSNSVKLPLQRVTCHLIPTTKIEAIEAKLDAIPMSGSEHVLATESPALFRVHPSSSVSFGQCRRSNAFAHCSRNPLSRAEPPTQNACQQRLCSLAVTSSREGVLDANERRHTDPSRWPASTTFDRSRRAYRHPRREQRAHASHPHAKSPLLTARAHRMREAGAGQVTYSAVPHRTHESRSCPKTRPAKLILATIDQDAIRTV